MAVDALDLQHSLCLAWAVPTCRPLFVDLLALSFCLYHCLPLLSFCCITVCLCYLSACITVCLFLCFHWLFSLSMVCIRICVLMWLTYFTYLSFLFLSTAIVSFPASLFLTVFFYMTYSSRIRHICRTLMWVFNCFSTAWISAPCSSVEYKIVFGNTLL